MRKGEVEIHEADRKIVWGCAMATMIRLLIQATAADSLEVADRIFKQNRIMLSRDRILKKQSTCDSLAGLLVGWLAGWLLRWLAGWLAGWLVSWQAGWLGITIKKQTQRLTTHNPRLTTHDSRLTFGGLRSHFGSRRGDLCMRSNADQDAGVGATRWMRNEPRHPANIAKAIRQFSKHR